MLTMMVGVLVAATLLQVVESRRWRLRLDRTLLALADRPTEGDSKPQDGQSSAGGRGAYEPFDFSLPDKGGPAS